jgi:hypothetical protein
MSDQYPSHFAIEIDRVRLRRYLRAKWYLSWSLLFLLFSGLPMLGFLVEEFERGIRSNREMVVAVAKAVGIALAGSQLLALFLYRIFSHGVAARWAESIELTVEGPFLRLRQHFLSLTDRKLHFRSIVDYTTAQDFFMRWFGIETLQMTTIAGGNSSAVNVRGVKDCLKVRDMLSEIDRQRENQ